MPRAYCRQCGADLDQRMAPGRPRAYCSSRCKRLTEYEVRRLQRRLEGLESLAAEVRARQSPWDEGRLEMLNRQIEEATDRLGALVA